MTDSKSLPVLTVALAREFLSGPLEYLRPIYGKKECPASSPEGRLMPPDLLALTRRRQSSAGTVPGAGPEDRPATLLATTRQRDRSIAHPTPVDVQRLRRLLANEQDRADAAEALRILDAVVDSPLDLDASLFERIQSALCGDSQQHVATGQPFRVERPHSEPPPSVGPAGPPRTAEEPETPSLSEVAALASQMQGLTGLMRQQAESIQQGHFPARGHRSCQESRNKIVSSTSVPAEKKPRSPIRPQIRGLHVRQAGHHFVLPIDKIERALDVNASELPTVHGRAVAHVSGEVCDVVYLAGHLGLMPREDSSANTLMVVSEAGTRVCIAIDEVMGPVETTVTPMNTIFPKVAGLKGVATLDSGGLALVPDLSRLV